MFIYNFKVNIMAILTSLDIVSLYQGRGNISTGGPHSRVGREPVLAIAVYNATGCNIFLQSHITGVMQCRGVQLAVRDVKFCGR